jgi:Epoxide hydrolase N terminus
MPATGISQSTETDAASVNPFGVSAPEEQLFELRARIKATRWPERETVSDDSQGVPLAMMQELARYWATEYDWRVCERRLNSLPQFMTTIDGLDIHFVHVRSAHEDAYAHLSARHLPDPPGRRGSARRAFARGDPRVRTAARRSRPPGLCTHDGHAPANPFRLADSPMGLAAWFVDHGDGTGQPGVVGQVVQGERVGDLTRDAVLDNIALYC